MHTSCPDAIAIPADVTFIMKTLNDNQFEAFIVGGCVRDFIMGIAPKDWDIATSALPEQVKALFPKTFDTGIAHGTVTVVIHKTGYEVTTYRIDGVYTDSRHPDSVCFTDQLQADLLRRDFTMNAIAYHKDIGFVDPFHGREDIKARIIRGVGEASERFQEDALRMLRAVRFSAQLGFTIEAKTVEALLLKAPLIQKISIERVRDEILKTVMAENAERLVLLVESGLMDHIHSKTAAYFNTRLVDVLKYVKRCDKNPIHRLSLLFMFAEPDNALEIMRFFRFDNQTINEVALRVRWLSQSLEDDEYAVRKMINAIGRERLESVLYLKTIADTGNSDTLARYDRVAQKLQAIIANGDCCALPQLALNGDELKRLGVANGKAIGDMLQFLLDEVMRCPEKNVREYLTSLVKKRL